MLGAVRFRATAVWSGTKRAPRLRCGEACREGSSVELGLPLWSEGHQGRKKVSLPPHFLLWDSLVCHPVHHERTLLRDSVVSWQLLLWPFTYTLVNLLVYVPLGENCARIQLMGCDGAYSRQGQLK